MAESSTKGLPEDNSKEELSKSKEEVRHKWRIRHPLLLRLVDSSGLTVTSSRSLVSTGYASIAMGLLTVFRATPVLLYSLAYHYNKNNPHLNFSKGTMYVLVCMWTSFIMFVLLVLGAVLAASERVTKRSVLLLHPWGLLLLYLDVFVWLSLIVWMHGLVVAHPELSKTIFNNVHRPVVFFGVMYTECIIYGVLYYVYATYFIAAELTIIENYH